MARHASQMQRRSWAAAAAAAATAGNGSPGDGRSGSCGRGGEQAAVSAATQSFGSVSGGGESLVAELHRALQLLDAMAAAARADVSASLAQAAL